MSDIQFNRRYKPGLFLLTWSVIFMLYVFCSCVQNTGIAKASGNPYAMTRATVLVPFQDTETANFQARGIGYQCVELGVASHFAEEFHKHFLINFKNGPLPIKVITTLDRDGKNLISGFES